MRSSSSSSSARAVGEIGDDVAHLLLRGVGERDERAPARLVLRDLGVVEPASVDVAEEVVLGTDVGVHALAGGVEDRHAPDPNPGHLPRIPHISLGFDAAAVQTGPDHVLAPLTGTPRVGECGVRAGRLPGGTSAESREPLMRAAARFTTVLLTVAVTAALAAPPGSARDADPRVTGRAWTSLAPASTPNFAQASAVRTADGLQHVVWIVDEAGGANYFHTTIDAAGRQGAVTRVLPTTWGQLEHARRPRGRRRGRAADVLPRHPGRRQRPTSSPTAASTPPSRPTAARRGRCRARCSR